MYFFVLLEYIFSISEYSIYFHTWTLHSSGWTKYYSICFPTWKSHYLFQYFSNNARQLFSSKEEESYENTTARTHFSSYYLCSLWVLFCATVRLKRINTISHWLYSAFTAGYECFLLIKLREIVFGLIASFPFFFIPPCRHSFHFSLQSQNMFWKKTPNIWNECEKKLLGFQK